MPACVAFLDAHLGRHAERISASYSLIPRRIFAQDDLFVSGATQIAICRKMSYSLFPLIAADIFRRVVEVASVARSRGSQNATESPSRLSRRLLYRGAQSDPDIRVMVAIGRNRPSGRPRPILYVCSAKSMLGLPRAIFSVSHFFSFLIPPPYSISPPFAFPFIKFVIT